MSGSKSWDVLPTVVRHHFGDTGVTDEKLLQYADSRFEKVTLDLEPGDVLYGGSHVLHWVRNGPGLTQHLQLIYPDYRILDRIFGVLTAHQALGRLSPETVAILASAAPVSFGATYSGDAFTKHINAQDAVLADLLSQGIFDSPWYDPTDVFANPEIVMDALTRFIP